MKDNELIAKFYYDEKLYCMFISENRKIKYAYLDNDGRMHFDLSKDDFDLVSDVFKSLMIDEKRSYYIREEKLKDKLYKIFYDPITKKYFWKSNQNIDNIEANVFFNMKYNNIPDVVYNTNNPEGEFKKFYGAEDAEDADYFRTEMPDKKRGRIIPILVKSAVSLVLLSNLFILGHIWNTGIAKIEEISGKKETVISASEDDKVIAPTNSPIIETIAVEIESSEVDDGYSWENIKQAIECNPNIGDEEKNFLYKLQFVFDENHQYMNLEQVISKLQTLKITYVDGFWEEDPFAGGSYSRNTNEIECYECSSFKDVELNVFLHEFFHVLQENYGGLIHEIGHEAFTREVIRRLHVMGETEHFNILTVYSGMYKYGKGYEFQIPMFYKIADLFPMEVLKQYEFKGDNRILVRELCKGSTDIEKDNNLAYQLIDLIKELGRYTTLMPGGDDLKAEIIEISTYFYELKGIPIEANANQFAYDLDFSERLSSSEGQFLLELSNKSDYMEYADMLGFQIGVQPKSYFSNAFPETIIYYKFDTNDSEGYTLLKKLGEYNQTSYIVVDENFVEAYNNYFNISPSRSK